MSKETPPSPVFTIPEVLGPEIQDIIGGTIGDFWSLVKQRVIMLLFTRPGELWDSDFGVGLDLFLFEQMTPAITTQIETRISNQFATYFPYLNLSEVTATPSPDDSFVVIRLHYKVPGFTEAEGIDIIFEPFAGVQPRTSAYQSVSTGGTLSTTDLGNSSFFYTESGILGIFDVGANFNPYLPS